MRQVTCVLVAIALAAMLSPTASATAPGASGLIAYGIQNSPGWDVRVVGADGTGDRRILFSAEQPAWSPDGARLAYRDLQSKAIWTADPDGTDPRQVSSPDAGESDTFPTWSPDGARLAFVRTVGAGGCSELFAVNADGTDEGQLAPTARCREAGLDWSPDGRLAYSGWDDGDIEVDLYVASADNTGASLVRSNAGDPSWSPSGTQIAFSRPGGSYRIWPDDPSGFVPIWTATPQRAGADQPDFAPDGNGFVLDTGGLFTVDDHGTFRNGLVSFPCCRIEHSDWQPVPPLPPVPGYARPKSATPLRVSLVPAYEPCAAPNREHGPPLAFGSCAPPAQRSSYLTVGGGDGGPYGANSVGFARFAVLTGDPGTAADEADVAVQVQITDVRCRAATFVGCTGEGVDYTGELDLSLGVRITDRFSGGTDDHPATLPDRHGFPQRDFSVEVPCAVTPNDRIGSTCGVTTTFDAFAPGGSALEGTRATWQLGQVVLGDGGEDGEASTDDNTAFAVQGVLVP